MVIFDIGLIAIIIAIIAAFIFLAVDMGIDGICQLILDNKEQTLLIATLIIFVVSILISCIINLDSDKNKRSFFNICGWSISLTFSISASTIFNIYNTIHTIQSIHNEFDLALRIIFFIVPLAYIVALVILYIVSYIVGLSTILLRLRTELDSRVTDMELYIIRVLSFIVPIGLYGMVSYLLLTNNNSIFTIFS